MSDKSLSNIKIPEAVRPVRPRRSVLYVPANNERALEKSLSLSSDVIIYDLEDAILPAQKATARETLRAFLNDKFPNGVKDSKKEILIRINSLSSAWGSEDLIAARAIMPSAILLPKVSEADDIIEVNDALIEMDTSPDLRLWAMIETPRGILNVASIARYARTPGTRLDCFIAGTNDLVKETGVKPQEGRPYLSNWLSQIVLSARAYGLDVIDGVYNDFKDASGFERESLDGRSMGFDGKSLIHPSQINFANEAFGIEEDALNEAQDIIDAFSEAKNIDAGVIQLNGKMVERLHLEMAEKLVAKSKLISN
ncbi:MAG: CoA ester lyase [Lentilitoribacter sp.]